MMEFVVDSRDIAAEAFREAVQLYFSPVRGAWRLLRKALRLAVADEFRLLEVKRIAGELEGLKQAVASLLAETIQLRVHQEMAFAMVERRSTLVPREDAQMLPLASYERTTPALEEQVRRSIADLQKTVSDQMRQHHRELEALSKMLIEELRYEARQEMVNFGRDLLTEIRRESERMSEVLLHRIYELEQREKNVETVFDEDLNPS